MASPRNKLFAASGRLLLIGAAVAASGCGPSGPPMGVVSGTVVVDGEPAADGSITLWPTDGVSSTAGGAVKEGRYSFEAPVGEAKVEIHVSKQVGEKRLYNTPDSPVAPVYADVLPPKYNTQTELLYVVEQGRQEKNFDLTTK